MTTTPPFSGEYQQEQETVISTLDVIAVNIGKVSEDEYDAYAILKEEDELECFQIKF